MNTHLYLMFLVASAQFGQLQAITCFVGEESELSAVTKSTWKFCSIIEGADGQPATHHGLGPENDNTDTYSLLFKREVMGPLEYAVLGACILENYVDALHGTNEFKVRCFCDSHNCNKGNNMAELFLGLQ